jgi:helitron helicase-like protein
LTLYNLNRPDLFLTFSAADYHWDSLQRHMPRYEEWKNGTAAERIKIARENVRDNPHIAAYHFHRRFTVLMEKVVTPKFKVKDHWNRYEWQGRGSTHNHGFVWSEDGLPEEDMG